jgi:hypothetical protein
MDREGNYNPTKGRIMNREPTSDQMALEEAISEGEELRSVISNHLHQISNLLDLSSEELERKTRELDILATAIATKRLDWALNKDKEDES